MSRSGYRSLAANGTEYARRVLRGEEPILQIPFRSFAVELGAALRPHFFALSSMAALAGAAGMRETSEVTPRTVVAAITCGLGWGVGQIVNDLMDRESDAVNAPGRAIIDGRLPAGPALIAAVALGALLSVTTVLVHPRAWIFLPMAVLLLVFYNAAKRVPVLGNVAHGALMTIAAAIGAASRVSLPMGDPESTTMFLRRIFAASPAFVAVAAIAAWYLQSNYEKDRPGDRAAGYFTLATVLPVRASAAVRAAAIVAIAVSARAMGLLSDAISTTTMVAGAALGIASTIGPMLGNSDQAALRAYRFAVVASILCMLALAAPLLGRWGTTALLAVALALVHAAFRRSENP